MVYIIMYLIHLFYILYLINFICALLLVSMFICPRGEGARLRRRLYVSVAT